jgi:hypothetical protein
LLSGLLFHVPILARRAGFTRLWPRKKPLKIP